MFEIICIAAVAIFLFILVGAVIHTSLKSVIAELKADVLASVNEIKKAVTPSAAPNPTTSVTGGFTAGGGGSTPGNVQQK